jgi:methyl-accepting chemotaxis protein
VSAAVNQMDQVTQQNAAMVGQSTATSRSLSQETAELAELLSQFQLGVGAAGDPLRRELKKVAPHAFGAAKAPPSRGAGLASVR